MNRTAATRSACPRLILATTFVLIGISMRPLLASVAPVLHDIIRDTGLDQTGAALITALPVLCLGLFAPIGPALARYAGTEQAVLCLLGLLITSALLRCVGVASVLLVSLLAAGGASGALGVLMPALVKRYFADRVGLMMGLYVAAICFGIALASGATVPLEGALGGAWNYALASWGLPALFAAVLLALQVPKNLARDRRQAPLVYGLWRDRLAWCVTLFMALQLAITYSAFGWLAPILRDRGLDSLDAGLVLSVSMLGQIGASFTMPIWAARRPDQRGAVLASVCLSLAGFLGCLYLPLSWVWLSTVLMGFGQGSMLSVGLVIVVLRSPSSTVAAALSGMAQGVGYSVAGVAPLALGLLRGWLGNWSHVGPCVVMLALLATIAGRAAAAATCVKVEQSSDATADLAPTH
jgi:MFS transporter, CP family, cyanate transporter